MFQKRKLQQWTFKSTGRKSYKKYIFFQNNYCTVGDGTSVLRKQNFIKKFERLELLVLYGLNPI